MTVPPEAVTAAAEVLHDENCDDGPAGTCPRWNSGNYPPGQMTHVEYYSEQATAVLRTAAPLIAAAERDRIRQGIPAIIAKFRYDVAFTAPELWTERLDQLGARLGNLLEEPS